MIDFLRSHAPKKSKLSWLYETIYINFGDYPPYTDALSEFLEAKVFSKIRCCLVFPSFFIYSKTVTCVGKES